MRSSSSISAADGAVGEDGAERRVELLGEAPGQVHGAQRVLEAAVLGGREHPARRLQLGDAPQALHPRGVDQVLLGRLAGDAARARVEDVLVDRVGDEPAALVGVGGALHDAECISAAAGGYRRWRSIERTLMTLHALVARDGHLDRCRRPAAARAARRTPPASDTPTPLTPTMRSPCWKPARAGGPRLVEAVDDHARPARPPCRGRATGAAAGSPRGRSRSARPSRRGTSRAGMARFTCGGSPSRSEAMPITRPRSSTTALPPQDGHRRAPGSARGRACTPRRPRSAARPAACWSRARGRCPRRRPTVPVTRTDRAVARGASVGRRPRPVALELHDAEPGVEVEADQPGRHAAAVARPRLDAAAASSSDVAHRDRVAARVEDDARCPKRCAPRRADEGASSAARTCRPTSAGSTRCT